jgi:hypothetical protein
MLALHELRLGVNFFNLFDMSFQLWLLMRKVW